MIKITTINKTKDKYTTDKAQIKRRIKIYHKIIDLGLQRPEDLKEFNDLPEQDQKIIIEVWSRHWAGEPAVEVSL